jgi:hypothetical protein
MRFPKIVWTKHGVPSWRCAQVGWHGETCWRFKHRRGIHRTWGGTEFFMGLGRARNHPEGSRGIPPPVITPEEANGWYHDKQVQLLREQPEAYDKLMTGHPVAGLRETNGTWIWDDLAAEAKQHQKWIDEIERLREENEQLREFMQFTLPPSWERNIAGK